MNENITNIFNMFFILHLSIFCHALGSARAIEEIIDLTKKRCNNTISTILETVDAMNDFSYLGQDLIKEIRRNLPKPTLDDLLRSNVDLAYAFSVNFTKLSQITYSLLISCREYTERKGKWTKIN